MNDKRTFSERLTTIETDVRWIKDNIAESKQLDPRVGRLERAWSYGKGAAVVLLALIGAAFGIQFHK